MSRDFSQIFRIYFLELYNYMISKQKVIKDFSALPQTKKFRINLYYLYFEPLYSPKATYLALQAYEFINTTCLET